MTEEEQLKKYATIGKAVRTGEISLDKYAANGVISAEELEEFKRITKYADELINMIEDKDEIIEYRGTYSALRAAGVGSYIKDVCHMYNLKLNIDIDKGWFREDGRFTITGKESLVDKAVKHLDEAVENYRNK